MSRCASAPTVKELCKRTGPRTSCEGCFAEVVIAAGVTRRFAEAECRSRLRIDSSVSEVQTKCKYGVGIRPTESSALNMNYTQSTALLSRRVNLANL